MKLEELSAEGVRLLQQYRRAPEHERTLTLRSLAVILVDSREHFLTADGSPDMKGRTWAYRQYVNDLYSSAGIPNDERLAIQAAARYHVGEVVRSRLSAEELEDLGLQPRSPKQAVRERRAANSAKLSILSQKDFQGGALMNLTVAAKILRDVEAGGAVAGEDPEVRAVTESTLREIRRTSDRLLRRVNDEPTPR